MISALFQEVHFSGLFFNNEFLRCPIFQLLRDFRPLVYFADDDEYGELAEYGTGVVRAGYDQLKWLSRVSTSSPK